MSNINKMLGEFSDEEDPAIDRKVQELTEEMERQSLELAKKNSPYQPIEDVEPLKKKVMKNMVETDFLMCTVFAALHNDNAVATMRPFPERYDPQNIFAKLEMKTIVCKIPYFDQINWSTMLRNDFYVLNWIVTQDKEKYLWHVQINDILIPSIRSEMNTCEPNAVFEVKYSWEFENHWRQIGKEKKIVFGYHGSSLVHVHSILTNGLDDWMNFHTANDLYSNGFDLCNNLISAAARAPFHVTWPKSKISDSVSVVLALEIIEDKGAKRRPSHLCLPDCQTNDFSYMRIKYILIYYAHREASAAELKLTAAATYLIMSAASYFNLLPKKEE